MWIYKLYYFLDLIYKYTTFSKILQIYNLLDLICKYTTFHIFISLLLIPAPLSHLSHTHTLSLSLLMMNYATGCIHEYDAKHPEGSGIGFKEEETPNFHGSFYSKTKAMVQFLSIDASFYASVRVSMNEQISFSLTPRLKSYWKNLIMYACSKDKGDGGRRERVDVVFWFWWFKSEASLKGRGWRYDVRGLWWELFCDGVGEITGYTCSWRGCVGCVIDFS